MLGRYTGSRGSTDSALHTRGVSTFVSSHFRLDEEALRAYLDRKSLVVKVRRLMFAPASRHLIGWTCGRVQANDSHFVVRECPLCSKSTYGKADNMWKLYIKRADGAFHCHRCGQGGSWFDFKQRLGDISVQVSSTSGIVSGRTSGGTPADTATRAPMAAQVAAAHTASLLDDGKFPRVLEYLTNTRGLLPDVLRMYAVVWGVCGVYGSVCSGVM